MYFKPLKVFFPIAFFLFLIGIADLIYIVLTQNNVSELSILLILASFQIGFLGLLADLIVKRGG